MPGLRQTAAARSPGMPFLRICAVEKLRSVQYPYPGLRKILHEVRSPPVLNHRPARSPRDLQDEPE
jgi:hypothetical protein